MFAGLHKDYSGDMHRAVLGQDAEAVDLRCIRVRRECFSLFEEVVGVPYTTKPGKDMFDVDTLPPDTDVVNLSVQLGHALRKAGYRILWQPFWSVQIGKGQK